MLETDFLNLNRNVMIALGYALQDILGLSTVVKGLACTPGTGLSVSLAAGRIYSLQNVDNLPYSTLPADTADQIMKQGINTAATVLALTAPTISGQSINYLIEAAYNEIDTNATLLNFYNSDDPETPYVGPNNTGQNVYTTRKGVVSLAAKAGAPATTGSQTTPSADSGYVGLYVVTIANGASSVVTGNISTAGGAPFLTTPFGTQ